MTSSHSEGDRALWLPACGAQLWQRLGYVHPSALATIFGRSILSVACRGGHGLIVYIYATYIAHCTFLLSAFSVTSAAPYPGEGEGGGDVLPSVLVAMRGEASLGLNSLRMRVPAAQPSSAAHYGLLRYDALGTGRSKSPLATDNLLEDTDGLHRPLPRGGGGRRNPSVASRCGSLRPFYLC